MYTYYIIRSHYNNQRPSENKFQWELHPNISLSCCMKTRRNNLKGFRQHVEIESFHILGSNTTVRRPSSADVLIYKTCLNFISRYPAALSVVFILQH